MVPTYSTHTPVHIFYPQKPKLVPLGHIPPVLLLPLSLLAPPHPQVVPVAPLEVLVCPDEAVPELVAVAGVVEGVDQVDVDAEEVESDEGAVVVVEVDVDVDVDEESVVLVEGADVVVEVVVDGVYVDVVLVPEVVDVDAVEFVVVDEVVPDEVVPDEVVPVDEVDPSSAAQLMYTCHCDEWSASQ